MKNKFVLLLLVVMSMTLLITGCSEDIAPQEPINGEPDASVKDEMPKKTPIPFERGAIRLEIQEDWIPKEVTVTSDKYLADVYINQFFTEEACRSAVSEGTVSFYAQYGESLSGGPSKEEYDGYCKYVDDFFAEKQLITVSVYAYELYEIASTELFSIENDNGETEYHLNVQIEKYKGFLGEPDYEERYATVTLEIDKDVNIQPKDLIVEFNIQ